MIRLKYMLAPAIIFCCAPALQATTSPLDPIIVGQNHSPRKKNLGKSNIQRLNNEIEKALTTYNKQSSAINENRVDSIIYKADGNATKTIYTYDKEGNSYGNRIFQVVNEQRLHTIIVRLLWSWW